MLHHEVGPERMDMVVDMVGEAGADLEDHEAVMVEAAADLWALLLHLGTGDVVRGQVPTAVEVAAALEAEEVVTNGLLHDMGILLAI